MTAFPESSTAVIRRTAGLSDTRESERILHRATRLARASAYDRYFSDSSVSLTGRCAYEVGLATEHGSGCGRILSVEFPLDRVVPDVLPNAVKVRVVPGDVFKAAALLEVPVEKA